MVSNGFGSEMWAKVFQAVNSYKPVSSGEGCIIILEGE